jgi:hypothetical protein
VELRDLGEHRARPAEEPVGDGDVADRALGEPGLDVGKVEVLDAAAAGRGEDHAPQRARGTLPFERRIPATVVEQGVTRAGLRRLDRAHEDRVVARVVVVLDAALEVGEHVVEHRDAGDATRVADPVEAVQVAPREAARDGFLPDSRTFTAKCDACASTGCVDELWSTQTSTSGGTRLSDEKALT